MPVLITPSNAKTVAPGAPLLASCLYQETPGIFGGPCKDASGNILTLRDYVVDCVRDAFDNETMSFQGIDDIEFDLDYGATRCVLLSRRARRGAYDVFNWRYKWRGDNDVPIRNDPDGRCLPEGKFRRFLGQTLRLRSEDGDRHALTGFLIDGVYDRLACVLTHQIKFANPKRRGAKRRAAYFVEPHAIGSAHADD